MQRRDLYFAVSIGFLFGWLVLFYSVVSCPGFSSSENLRQWER